MGYIDLLTPAVPHPSPMHIPDGFLSGPVAGIGYALAAVFVALAVWRTNRSLSDKSVPLMGVLAAFIPDGFLSGPVAGIGYALAAVFVALAVWRTNRSLSDKSVPLMGVLAAFIF